MAIPGSTITPAIEMGSSSNNGLPELIYICDHLAHFPYKTVDEIYHLAHSLDLRISTIGSALVRSLQDCLVSSSQLKAECATASTADPNADPPLLVYDRKVGIAFGCSFFKEISEVLK